LENSGIIFFLEVEREQEYRALLSKVIQGNEKIFTGNLQKVPENSLASDLLRGYEERIQTPGKASLCDYVIQISDHHIPLHQCNLKLRIRYLKLKIAILAARCPILLNVRTINATFPAFDLLLKYIYSDILPIPYPDAQGASSHEGNKKIIIYGNESLEIEKILLELRDLARQLQLPRLDSICELILRGTMEEGLLPQIGSSTLGVELLHASRRENE
jgi:hypothetical protein